MLPQWVIMLLVLIAEVWSVRRDGQIRFLKLQLELYTGKMPGNRVVLSPEERQRLLRLGEEVGHRVDDLTLVATRHNPVIRDYYLHLQQQGKAKKVALVACMRKLLIRLNALMAVPQNA